MEREFVKKVFERSLPVYLSGESGTGKSTLARELHQEVCPHRNFSHVNLASIPEALAESILFGHRKGSFSGAIQDQGGVFGKDLYGTVFLDEVFKASENLRQKLLCFLDTKEFSPIGSGEIKQFRGKLIFASSENIMSDPEFFGNDFVFRISNFHYRLPSLRENPRLLRRLIHSEMAGVLSEEQISLLCLRAWTGNYRELRQVFQKLRIIKEYREILDSDLQVPLNSSLTSLTDYYSAKEKFESEYLEETLKRHLGRINETARFTGISKTTLLAKMRKYGIDGQQIKDLTRLKSAR